MGLRQLKQMKFAEAEQHFRTAIKRLTNNYTSPKDGEPFYYLGVTLQEQGKYDDAYDAFFKSTWSQAWRGPAYFGIAQIDTRRGNLDLALDHVNRSLNANDLNTQALNLKATLLRHLNRPQEVLAMLDAAEKLTDRLDVRLLTERWRCASDALKLRPNKDDNTKLTTMAAKSLKTLKATTQDFPEVGLETITEYGDAGLWEDGGIVCGLMVDVAKDKQHVSPLAYYCVGHFAELTGKADLAAEYRKRAAAASPDNVFPFQWEAIAALRGAVKANPEDSRAVLSGQSAVRLAAGRSDQTLGTIGEARSVACDCASQSGGGVCPSKANAR